ncbi:adenylyl-sulfate kinase [Marinicellulosiphila megalodicopiae]|uniref:adenylyl-sulfate kinase n=1 Tax=Marinicellulosiphila megalodicopiae TaxID=2724896 RepID=UPI003BB00170
MSDNITWHPMNITKQDRATQKQQIPCVIWFTGLSGSGKSTIANLLEQYLYHCDYHCSLLDGDNLRHGLNKDLGFSESDRIENIRRAGEVAKLLSDSGLMVISAFISPFHSERQLVRELFLNDHFIEIHVDASLSVCEQRDPKGLYVKARQGQITNFTGIDSIYEPPKNPDIYLNTDKQSPEACLEIIINVLNEKGLLVNKDKLSKNEKLAAMQTTFVDG